MSKRRSLEDYRQQNDEYLKSIMRRLTRVPKEALAAALKTAVDVVLEETLQDSGNAAFHWEIINIRKKDQTVLGENASRDLRGSPPVGNRGDKGANRAAVIAAVKRRAYDRIEKLVFEQHSVSVTLYNPITPERYATNANIRDEMITEIAAKALNSARTAGMLAAYKSNFGK